jgi:hypothetical protein
VHASSPHLLARIFMLTSVIRHFLPRLMEGAKKCVDKVLSWFTRVYNDIVPWVLKLFIS